MNRVLFLCLVLIALGTLMGASIYKGLTETFGTRMGKTINQGPIHRLVLNLEWNHSFGPIFSPGLSRITLASDQVRTPSSKAISHAGFSLGLASTAAFVLSYKAALTGLNLSHFHTGHEVKKTIAVKVRITPTI